MNSDQNRQGAPPKTDIICSLCESGKLWKKCNAYICSCSNSSETDTRSKKRSRFPNLAGLCRYLGTGLDDLRRLREKYPESYDRLLAIFEDEALNYDASTTILSSYMKKRLLFRADEEVSIASDDTKEVCYCFEHDIAADGE